MADKPILGWAFLDWLAKDCPVLSQTSTLPFPYLLARAATGFILDAAEEVLPPEKRQSGQRWISARCKLDAGSGRYFGIESEEPINTNRHILRVVQLGELLYNLQSEPGTERIYHRLIRDRNENNVEAIMLELKGLRLLWLARLPFIIKPVANVKGKDYECEINLSSGCIVYCEMKCRISSDFSRSILHSEINKARSQLPRGCCGLVLIKVPDEWYTSPEIREALVPETERILWSTERISEVVYYAELNVRLNDSHMAEAVGVQEVLNPNPKSLARLLNGGIFKDRISMLDGVPTPIAFGTNWVSFWMLTSLEVLRQIIEVHVQTPPHPPNE